MDMKISLQEAIEILKIEKGVAELAMSNGEGNVHTEEFINAVDVVFDFIKEKMGGNKKWKLRKI